MVEVTVRVLDIIMSSDQDKKAEEKIMTYNTNPTIEQALNVIDHAQYAIWELHLVVKNNHDNELGMKIWEQTLQIEHAVKVLREELEAIKN